MSLIPCVDAVDFFFGSFGVSFVSFTSLFSRGSRGAPQFTLKYTLIVILGVLIFILEVLNFTLGVLNFTLGVLKNTLGVLKNTPGGAKNHPQDAKNHPQSTKIWDGGSIRGTTRLLWTLERHGQGKPGHGEMQGNKRIPLARWRETCVVSCRWLCEL